MLWQRILDNGSVRFVFGATAYINRSPDDASRRAAYALDGAGKMPPAQAPFSLNEVESSSVVILTISTS